MGRTGAVSYGSLRDRWFRGVSWTWVNERYRDRLPEAFDVNAMAGYSMDRLHSKQGRVTARLVFHAARDRRPGGPGVGMRPLAVYLKKHSRLPWSARICALVDPAGGYSPAAAEWAHLDSAKALGIPVPDVVAAGEQIGPRAALQSFLMVAELTGCEALNELLPQLKARLDDREFAALKRRLIPEMARIIARMHSAGLFHRDLYLCHFFLDCERLRLDTRDIRIVLIDLHRLASGRFIPDWWRWKDLGQLLYSTDAVAGLNERDLLRFWRCYRRNCRIRWAAAQAALIRFRAARYRRHNRKWR
jgi:heptose I phosphotransferase